MSPSSLLRKRRGNSFEMATLLCSMLIGAGLPAVVVSGVARTNIVENNQRNVPYPYEIIDLNVEKSYKQEDKAEQTYKLRPMPDLDSHLDENMAKILAQKESEEQRIRDEIARKELEVIFSHHLMLYYY